MSFHRCSPIFAKQSAGASSLAPTRSLVLQNIMGSASTCLDRNQLHRCGLHAPSLANLAEEAAQQGIVTHSSINSLARKSALRVADSDIPLGALKTLIALNLKSPRLGYYAGQ